MKIHVPARLCGHLNRSPSDFILGSKMPKMHLFAQCDHSFCIPPFLDLPCKGGHRQKDSTGRREMVASVVRAV